MGPRPAAEDDDLRRLRLARQPGKSPSRHNACKNRWSAMHFRRLCAQGCRVYPYGLLCMRRSVIAPGLRPSSRDELPDGKTWRPA